MSSAAYGKNGEPVIFVYEGGIGLAEKAYEILPDLFATTHTLVRDCRCEDGCPSCIYATKCGNYNQHLDKSATILIMGDLCWEPLIPEPVMDSTSTETASS